MESVLPARVGREKQRYSGQKRLVCGTVPYRWQLAADGGRSASVEYLLIRSAKRHNWIFPKGGWETDESAEEAAVRETLEESGVKGKIVQELSEFPDMQSKSGKPFHLRMFLLEVHSQLESYAEMNRSRQWVNFL